MVPSVFLCIRLGVAFVGGDELTVLKVLLDWLKDVYQRYGWQAVLVCLVVVVALALAVYWVAPSVLLTALGG